MALLTSDCTVSWAEWQDGTRAEPAALRREAEDLCDIFGRPVVPLSGSGTPLIKWGPLAERPEPPPLRELRRWPWRGAVGLALVLGRSNRLGGHLWALDAESRGRHHVEAELDCERPGWRQGCVVESQRAGVHIYVLSERPVKAGAFVHGCVLASGKLVVMPPTPPFKVDGQRPYRWLSCNVDELLVGSPETVVPRWWLDDDGSACPGAETPLQPRREAATALGAALAQVLSRPDVLPRVLVTLGLPPDLSPAGSRAVLCVFCAERRPSMSLWTPPNGEPVLHVWHRCAGAGGLEFVPLPTAYAAKATGRLEPLRGAGYAAWKLKLLCKAGVLPALPEPVDDDAETLLATLRWLSKVSQALAGEPAVPASRAFLCELLGWPERRVRAAFAELLRSGRLQRASRSGPALWFPR